MGQRSDDPVGGGELILSFLAVAWAFFDNQKPRRSASMLIVVGLYGMVGGGLMLCCFALRVCTIERAGNLGW